jgi:carboxyl-terminal processing protease
MTLRRISVIAGLLVGLAGAAAADPAPAADPVLDQIDRIVRAHFYSADVLRQRGWDAAVRDARAALAGATGERRRAVLVDLLRRLATSHTEYIAPDEPRHAQILSIFEAILPEAKDRCPDLSKLPALPVRVPDIGVWWTRDGDRWFVGGIIDGGPAQKAGLLLGDEVVTAGGRRFQPVPALAAGGPVRLGVRRSRGGPLRTIAVTPRVVGPQQAFRDAIGASARIVERRGARVAYVRVWSWAGIQMQQALEEAIADLNRKAPTAFVVDIRDGWGGASPDYLRIFDTRAPVLTWIDRAGVATRRDPTIRVPAVLITNRGSRSGKEIIAYAVKKHRLATIVGESTGAAVVPGGIYCLDDGALLYLASSWLTVDGEVLEGVGVAPDVAVPFDVRHAAGRDRQLDAAIDAAIEAARR